MNMLNSDNLRHCPAPTPLNTSGVDPLDQRVVVLPDSAEQITAGGIIIPQQAVEKEQWAQTKGTLIAAGVNAWAEAKAAAGFVAPEPGARVMVAKYGGVSFKGADGKDYRIMNDEDVTGVLKES
jgi:chaperonin GroES